MRVTEWDEPQAVIGSYLHKYAYPDYYKAHLDRRPRLHGSPRPRLVLDAQCIQLRGEYLYVAEGTRGMRVYDVASIANKDISERIITAPVSPLGPGHAYRVEERHLRRAADQPADQSGAQCRQQPDARPLAKISPK